MNSHGFCVSVVRLLSTNIATHSVATSCLFCSNVFRICLFPLPSFALFFSSRIVTVFGGYLLVVFFPGVMLLIKRFACDCFASGSLLSVAGNLARIACIPLFRWCLETCEFALFSSLLIAGVSIDETPAFLNLVTWYHVTANVIRF